MKLKKSFVTLILCLYLSLILPCLIFASLPRPKIVIDGNQVKNDLPPIIHRERILVPLRVISDYMGYEVHWNDKTKKISIISPTENKEIILTVGESSAQIAGNLVTLDCAPIMEKERTFVPLRFIAEYYNKKVSWQHTTRTVYIGDAPATVVKDQANLFQEPLATPQKVQEKSETPFPLGNNLSTVKGRT